MKSILAIFNHLIFQKSYLQSSIFDIVFWSHCSAIITLTPKPYKPYSHSFLSGAFLSLQSMARDEEEDVEVMPAFQFNGIGVIQKLLIKEYILPAESINDYLNGVKPSRTHRLKYYINIGILISNLIKFTLLYFNSNDHFFIKIYGEFAYVLYNMEFLSLLCIVASLFFIAILIIGFKIHSVEKLFVIEMMNNMKSETISYGLSQPRLIELEEHYDKFVKFLVIFCRPVVFLTFGTALSVACYYSYLDESIEHETILLIMSLINWLLLLDRFVLIQIVSLGCYYYIIAYVKYMFRDLDFEFMGSITFKQPARLRETFRLHSNLILIIKKTSSFINYIIGLYFYLIAIILALELQVIFSEDANIYQRFVFVWIGIATLFYGIIVSRSSGWIDDRNKKLAKHIYTIFSIDNIRFWRRFRTLLIRCDEFMSEIFGIYVGYFCFFTPFTAQSSLNFFLNLGSWYMLLKNL